MKLIKTVKVVNKRDFSIKEGYLICECPKCENLVSLNYEIKNNETIFIQKYCSYCGRKLVNE